MATLRATSTPITSIFRFASQPASTRRCTHCLKAQRCPFSSFRPALQSSKRPLMTDSAYRPQSLEPELPPPPRNAGVPDTSITAGQQQQQQQPSWPPTALWERKGSAGTSERESEAQESKPTAAAQPTTSTTQTTAPPQPSPTSNTAPKKSKLRPRKAAMQVTPGAIRQLRTLLNSPDSKLVRVGVKNRGCSGLAYHLEYVDKPGPFDEAVEQDGVKVLIDSKALFSIIGSEMDWVEDKLSARFVFRNPNVTEACGCGESFSIS